MKADPIRGKSIRWTFTDGPLAKKTFEHTFDADGGVAWRMLEGDVKGKPTHVDVCLIDTVGEDVHAVSYLGSSGYTLTVVLDYRTGKMVAFASNDKEVTVQHGTFEAAGTSEKR